MKALLLDKTNDGQINKVTDVSEAGLPEGDVLVDVSHSTLNYKDGLAITGQAPVVRSWPMIPGIDFAGTVAESSHADFEPGDRVVLNGWGLGETRWGGYAERARVKGDWLIPLPSAFDTAQAMAIGTAGYAAMLCVLRLEEHGVVPDAGPILVTGASGGVGSVAITLLAKRGYEIAALTGRTSEADYLKGLGAADIVARADFATPAKPLSKERWAGAVDSIGSHVLANVLTQMKYGGTVAACGLAMGMDLSGSVAPFILRGVTLAGVDSVYASLARRKDAWSRLAEDLTPDHLASMTETVGLDEIEPWGKKILAGQVRGRVVVAVRG